MAKKVLVPIADGSEDLEAITIIDVLRRAEADLTVASVGARQITASRGTNIVADALIDACADGTYDLIVLPGGMPGAAHLGESETLVRMLKEQRQAGRLYAAICAAPAVVFQPHGLLEGRRATCYPTYRDRLDNREAVEERVVVDGNCVTSQGPGTAIAFALTLVELLYDEETAQAVAKRMLVAG
jgi:4-methyl-5(b-hydroxyethyl)-thiazole monophosphate biosynthesis